MKDVRLFRIERWDEIETLLDNTPPDIVTQLNLKEDKSNKGVANWYASLDSSWFIPSSQLPPSSWLWDMTKSVYDPTSVSWDAFDMDNMIEGSTNLILSPAERNYLKNIQSTSSITTPTVSINTDTTKFDIWAFVWVFIDNYTDSNNPTRIILNYAWTTANVVTNLATADATILTINSSWTIIQRTRQPTIEELRDEILIWSLTHTNRTNISTAVSVWGVPSYDIANSLFAGSVALWPVNLAWGNIYTWNSTSWLKLDKTAGNTYQIWINRYNNPKNPDITTDTAWTAITFLYSWRDWSWGFNSLLTDTLLPWRYDNWTGWTWQPNWLASNNKWYLCKIYRTVVSNLTIIEFWQVEYASLSEAIANKWDTTVVNPILWTTQFRGWLALRGWATDIYTNWEADWVFIDAWIFSTTTWGSSLWTATTTLNWAYLNSTQPQIEVDDTRGSLQAKNNRALDTSAVFEVLNKAWTPTVSVTWEGKINWNTISSWTTSWNNTWDETTATIWTLINSATEKTTPVDTDMVWLMDSWASNILKKLSWLNIKATAKTYFDTVYDALWAASTAETNAKSYADWLVVWLWDDRWTFDASVNAYPSTWWSWTAWAILKWDTWTVSVAWTLPTAQVVEIWDIVRALTDTPWNTQANWAIQQNNIWYTAENSANKSTTLDADKTSDTKYPSVKSVYDWAVWLFASKWANSDITSLSWLTTPLSIAQGWIWSTTLAWASIATYAWTETLTNKRITTRVNTITSSATPTPAWDTTDEFTVTALAADATFAAPTGTPTEWQVLLIRIKDDWTARTLAWNAIYRASSDLALPTTTVISKTLYLQFVYNDTDSKWDLLGLLNNF